MVEGSVKHRPIRSGADFDKDRIGWVEARVIGFGGRVEDAESEGDVESEEGGVGGARSFVEEAKFLFGSDSDNEILRLIDFVDRVANPRFVDMNSEMASKICVDMGISRSSRNAMSTESSYCKAR